MPVNGLRQRRWQLQCVALAVGLLLLGCSEAADAPPAAGPVAAEVRPTNENANEGESMSNDPQATGEAIAREAIETFDKAVAEFAAVLADKPDDATALPKLEAIYETCRPKMEALAERRKAITDPEVRMYFSRYMNENRPKAVFRKDEVLGAFVAHYRFMKPGPKILEFLDTKVLALLNLAHEG